MKKDETEQSDPASSNDGTSEEEAEEEVPIVISISPETCLRLRDCALRELYSTEEGYIESLGYVVHGYLGEVRNENSDIPMPDDLKGGPNGLSDKMKMVFKNIENIYDWHQNIFIGALQKSLEDPCELEKILMKFKQKLQMYVVYCQNKPYSDHIVSMHEEYFEKIRQKLNHKLGLNDLLIKPVQRITKYELLMRDILKQSKRAGKEQEAASLEKALEIIKTVNEQINNMMIVRRMHECDKYIAKHDKLFMHGTLRCIEFDTEIKKSKTFQKPKDLEVFLFQQNMIFCDIIGEKTRFNQPIYHYFSHIPVSMLSIEDSIGTRDFCVKSKDEKRSIGFICESKTKEMHKRWFETISHQVESLKNLEDVLLNPLGHSSRSSF